jgi:hypothetical protein
MGLSADMVGRDKLTHVRRFSFRALRLGDTQALHT